MENDIQQIINMASTQPNGEVEPATPPAGSWVRFLRSYGPTPNNLTMFDEYVTGALGRAKVQPITLTTPLLDKMIQHIESKAPGSLLIAGTAGDGKTYHCRALWTRIGGDPKAWAAKGNVKEHRLVRSSIPARSRAWSKLPGMRI